ncbi:hypothetical protein OQ853_23720 (plasmid) [Enterobacter roggenkampii]|nr:hypothetical protein [Enterobacter roggenkampii]MDK4552290.1 hypothetical protein [Enterobacter roggenkampii]
MRCRASLTAPSAKPHRDESKASCFGRRAPEDGRLDWNKPARQLHNLVRAVTDPWPGAYSFAGVSKFIVWKSACVTTFRRQNRAPSSPSPR